MANEVPIPTWAKGLNNSSATKSDLPHLRTDDAKIAEHWSVEQPITPLEEVANEHPHF